MFNRLAFVFAFIGSIAQAQPSDAIEPTPQDPYFQAVALLDEENPDMPAIIALMRQSAESGNGQAQWFLLHSAGVPGTGVTDEEALKWLKSVALTHLPSAYLLAGRYLTGDGVPKSERRGLRLLQDAAEGGYGPAALALGELLIRKGGEKMQEGLQWLDLAGQAGSVEGWGRLGYLLLSGDLGVPVDALSGMNFLHKASREGFADAAELIGMIHSAGAFGQAQDDSLAAAAFKKAGELGSDTAKMTYALMLYNGAGLPADKVSAEAILTELQDKRKNKDTEHAGADTKN